MDGASVSTKVSKLLSSSGTLSSDSAVSTR